METITMIINALAVIDLVSLAFATIENLASSFNTFIHSTFGDKSVMDDEDIRSLKQQLQDQFIQTLKHCCIFENPHDNIRKLILDKYMWESAFDSFKLNIISLQNQKYINFDYAFKNIATFSNAISVYMQNFASENRCAVESIEYVTKFEYLKYWIQNQVSKRIDTHKNEHYENCENFGFEYNASTYWCCNYCQTRLRNTWMKRFNNFKNFEFEQFVSEPLATDEFDTLDTLDTKNQQRKKFDRKQMNKRSKFNGKYVY